MHFKPLFIGQKSHSRQEWDWVHLLVLRVERFEVKQLRHAQVSKHMVVLQVFELVGERVRQMRGITEARDNLLYRPSCSTYSCRSYTDPLCPWWATHRNSAK